MVSFSVNSSSEAPSQWQPATAQPGMARLDAIVAKGPQHRSRRAFRPGPGVAEPEGRQHGELRLLGPPIADQNADGDVLRCQFGVLHRHIEIAILGEDPSVQQFEFRLVAAPATVFCHKPFVGIGGLGVLVEGFEIGVGGSAVEIEIVFLHVLAMIALIAGEAEQTLLEDRIVSIPQRQRETEQLLIVTEAQQPVLAPAVGPRARLIMGEVVPGGAIGAVVLPHRSPLALGQIGPPLFPPGVPQSLLLGVHGVHGGEGAEGKIQGPAGGREGLLQEGAGGFGLAARLAEAKDRTGPSRRVPMAQPQLGQIRGVGPGGDVPVGLPIARIPRGKAESHALLPGKGQQPGQIEVVGPQPQRSAPPGLGEHVDEQIGGSLIEAGQGIPFPLAAGGEGGTEGQGVKGKVVGGKGEGNHRFPPQADPVQLGAQPVEGIAHPAPPQRQGGLHPALPIDQSAEQIPRVQADPQRPVRGDRYGLDAPLGRLPLQGQVGVIRRPCGKGHRGSGQGLDGVVEVEPGGQQGRIGLAGVGHGVAHSRVRR